MAKYVRLKDGTFKKVEDSEDKWKKNKDGTFSKVTAPIKEEKKTITKKTKKKEAEERAKQKSAFDYQFSKKDEQGNLLGGLSWDEVQEEKKKYASDSAEYKYLSNYTNFATLQDFDKALAYEKAPFQYNGQRLTTEQVKQNGLTVPLANAPRKISATDMILNGKGKIPTPNFDASGILALPTFGQQNVSNQVSYAQPNSEYINELEKAKNIRGLDNQFDYYKHYTEKKDFEEKSAYNPKFKAEKNWLGNAKTLDQLYMFMNVDEKEQDKYLMENFSIDGSMGMPEEINLVRYMRDDEKKVFNYLFNTDREKANEYFEDIKPNLSRRNAQRVQGQVEKMSEEMPVTSSILSVPLNVIGGASGGVQTAIDKVQGKETDYYGSAFGGNLMATTIRNKVGQDIADSTEGVEVLGTNVPSFLYQSGMSVSDTLLGSTIFGKGYSVIAGSSAYQTKARELYEAGEDRDTIEKVAIASGTVEVLFEYLSIDKLMKETTVIGAKQVLKSALKQAGVEASEEFCTEIANIYIDEFGRGGNSDLSQMRKELKAQGYSESEINKKIHQQMNRQIGEALVGGALSGGFMGGGMSAVNNAKYTDTEKQFVSDIVQERADAKEKESGKKLTTKERLKIQDDVVNELHNGDFTREELEERFGGDSYTEYQQLLKDNDEYTSLLKMKNGDRTGEQDDRLYDLRKMNNEKSFSDRLAESRSKLADTVKTATGKSGLLDLAYGERGRRTEKFTVSEEQMKKYSAKEKEIVQKAIDYGEMNNTRKAHEFVDLVAKLSADKGVSFDFTNNEKLKNSGFALEGKTINGFKQGNNITINLQSKNALNTVVGHEITHVLEGTELYQELQNTVIEYAKQKGVYDSMYKDIVHLYRNQFQDNDLQKRKQLYDSEITADLVGQYIFSDVDFVRNLSMKNRNVFQKVYDEIKYMLKSVKAGSDAEKQLLKAKKIFEDVYRDTKKNTSDKTQMSIDDIDIELDRIYEEMTLEEAEALIMDIEDLIKLPSKWGLEIEETKVSKPRYKGDTKTKGKVAKLTDERIEHLFNEYGASNPSYAKAYVTSIHPRDFLSLTLSDESLEKWDNATKQGTDAEYRPLDVEKLKNERQTPFLEVDTETGRVTGHEGRHRMRALLEAGITEVPIAVIDINTKYSKQKESSMRLKSQEFYEGYVNDNFKTEVKNLIPLNKVNSSEIYSTYGGKGDIQYSLTDNKGRTLTKEQQEKFKDSKVRDENGNLLTMYHGTPNGDYTIFRDGTYFTQNKEYADVYQNQGASSLGYKKTANNPKTYEVYLDIKKPFDTRNPKERAIFENEYYGQWGMGTPLMESGLPDWMDGEDLREFLEEKGYDYDGLILDEGGVGGYGDDVKSRGYSYVVFNPNQVKNVDNAKPTDNADIRYSVSDNKGRKLTESQQEHFKDSKVRDEKGNLLEVYHGSKSNGFNIFEYSPNRQTGADFGKAYYFTSDYEKASGYSYDSTKDSRVQKYKEERKKRLDRFLETRDEADRQAFLNVKVDGKTLDELMNDESYSTGGEVKSVYLNLKNPLIVDADGKYYYEVYEQYFKEARESGKDGIIVKNVIDNPRREHRPIDVYIAFENNQIKNVDNTKPTDSPDIRFSLSNDIDAEYMQAVEKGDIYSAQKMVDKVARENGYTKRMFHETDAENIHIFDISKGTHGGNDSQTPYGIFTKSSDKNIGLGKKQMALYVKADNTLYVENRDEVSKKIPQLIPYYDQIAEIDKKYDALAEEMEDVELGVLEEWMEANPDVDMDVVYPNSYIIEGKPADIDDAKYQNAFKERQEIMAKWRSETDAISIKCKDIITKHLRDNGYDSMYFMVDGGSFGRQTDSLIVLDTNQVKSANVQTFDDEGNVIPLSQRFNASNNDIRYSLSDKNKPLAPKPNGIYSEDIALERPIAPIKEDLVQEEMSAPLSNQVSNKEQDEFDLFMDLFDNEDSTQGNVEEVKDPFEERNIQEVGKRNVNAYMYDNPEVKPFFQEEANIMLGELQRSTKGERYYNDQLYYDTNGEQGFYGTKRETSDAIAELLDNYNYSYADIEKGLKAIIEDNGAENIAVAKKIEFFINERLMNGYTDFQSGIEFPKNQEYINLLEGMQADESSDSLTENTTPLAPIGEKIAQTHENAPIEEQTESEGIKGEDLTRKNAEKIKVIQGKIESYRMTRSATSKEFDERIANKQAEYEALQRKDTKKAVNLRNQITNLESRKDALLKDLDRKIERSTNQIENIEQESRFNKRQTKQKEFRELFGLLMGDTSTWVDKKMGIQYQTNTFRRNLRDIVRDANGKQDIAKADAIYDELQGSVNRNEALKNREGNALKNPFREMKINNHESTYIQMLGEFQNNPDSKLTFDEVSDYLNKHKKKIDVEKVNKAIEEARKLYDSLYDRVNEALGEHGFKEMGYRKGYFPHFNDPKQNWLAKLLNWKVQNDEIPTDIAGLTELFEPQRTYQSFDKHRQGDKTDYNFLKGLDNYVDGALDWIYHIEDIQKHRAFETEIRYRHSSEQIQKEIDKIRENPFLSTEEADTLIQAKLREAKNPLNNFVTDLHTRTNILAGKKSSKDRNMESDFNRHAYSVMTNITNRVNANQVAGSISSALTNFIPITQSWGQVNPTSSVVGMKQTIQSYIKDDGVVDKSDFLTNRLRQNENLYKTAWDRTGEVVGGLMEVVDNFTSQTVWRSKYYENIKKGMSEQQAIQDADQFAENVIAGRSKGNMPTIFHAKNPVSKMLTSFQLEVANQYGYMFKDMPNDIGKKAIGKLTKGYVTMFVGAYFYNALYSSLTGRDSAFDPIGILEDLWKDLFGDDEEEKKEPSEAIGNLAENIAQEIPFVGGLLGGGRVPISSALPYDASVKDAYKDVVDGDWKSVMNELSKPLYYGVLPMGGGQIRKTVQGLSMFDNDLPTSGSYTASGNLRFPVDKTVKNVIQSALFGQYANENARYYFDNNLAPLKPKQTQEYIDLDIPIKDYWKYREGLKEQETIEEKFDYVAGLEHPISKKNIMINNLVKRKEEVDLTDYNEYGSYEEYNWATNNSDKYDFLQENDISYSAYKENKEMYNWAFNNPDQYYVAKTTSIGFEKYYNHKKVINGISGENRKDKIKMYLKNLDIDNYTKTMLFKSVYPKDNTYKGN